LRATGAPGELALGGAAETVELLRATSAGLVRDRTLDLEACTGVTSRPNGAAVAAGDHAGEIVAYLREPGGAWGPRLTLDEASTSAVAVGVSDRGDAVVAWFQGSSHEPMRLRAAVRPAGGEFGPPATLHPRPVSNLRAAIAATGEAMVMWSTYDDEQRVQVATSTAGGEFAAPVTVGEIPSEGVPALAMAQDGHAIVALPLNPELQIVERAPGKPFAGLATVGEIDDRAGAEALAAIADGGAAAVAWNTLEGDGVHVVTRTRPGAFSPAATLQRDVPPPASADPFYDSEAWRALTANTPVRTGETSLTLTPDGRILLSSAGAAAELFTVGETPQRRALPRLVARPRGTAGLLLADGSPALASTGPAQAGRTTVHLGADGATGSTPAPPPTVTVRGSARARNGHLSLAFTCRAACDVASGDAFRRLTRPGSDTLRLPTDGTRTRTRTRVTLTYSAPNSPQTARKTTTVRVQDAGPRPPEVIGLTAVRRGSQVRVSWRTTSPLPRSLTFTVSGARTRSPSSEPLDAAHPFVSADRRSFDWTFDDAAQMRWITLRGGERRLQSRVR
jgi:hypothetical protein